MNLRDKIGQRLMVSFQGPELTPAVEEFLVESRAGGVIHFGHNIASLPQIRELNAALQDVATRHGLPPYLIGIDEEGGRVSRMPADAQRLIAPSPMAQSAAGPDAPAVCAGVTARNLRRLGFNLDFAPLADINNNPANPVIASRSYGSQPDRVSRAVAAAIEAYLQNGVAPCVKHFPGHGDTAVDSHLGLPVVSHSRARLDEIELEPFRAAFAAGAPALMTAHILYPQIETAGLPATLSQFFLKQVLRQEMGFQGLVFSDALVMEAIAGQYPIPEACYLTIQAGADIAMPLGSLATQLECVERLAEHAATLDLDQPLERILAFKARFCQPAPAEDADTSEADAQLLEEVARHSLTLVGAGTAGQWPFRADESRPVVIDFELPIASPVEEGRRPGPLLNALLAERWPRLRYLPLPIDMKREAVISAVEAAQSASLVLIISRNARRSPTQAALLQELAGVQPRTVLIAARDPYDLSLVSANVTRLATYGDPPVSLRALVAGLFGEFEPSGQLPVGLE